MYLSTVTEYLYFITSHRVCEVGCHHVFCVVIFGLDHVFFALRTQHWTGAPPPPHQKNKKQKCQQSPMRFQFFHQLSAQCHSDRPSGHSLLSLLKVADIISAAQMCLEFQNKQREWEGFEERVGGRWGVFTDRERCSAFAKENSFAGLDASGIKKPCD